MSADEPATYEELHGRVRELEAEVARLQDEINVKQARLWAITTTLQAKGNLGDNALFDFAARLQAFVDGSHDHVVKSHFPMVPED